MSEHMEIRPGCQIILRSEPGYRSPRYRVITSGMCGDGTPAYYVAGKSKGQWIYLWLRQDFIEAYGMMSVTRR